MSISFYLDTNFVFNFRVFFNVLTTIVFTFPEQDSLLSPFFYPEIYFSVADMRQKENFPWTNTNTFQQSFWSKYKKDMRNKKGNGCNSYCGISLGNQKPSLKNLYGGIKVRAAFQQNAKKKTFVKEV